jgi:hypothetical protein
VSWPASMDSSVSHKLSVNNEVDMEGECHSPMFPTVPVDPGH